MTELFDLNIEQVLENWSIADALREIIANALDEQVLSHSKPIEITKIKDSWYIRDYGRGIRYIHFTQNENEEKLQATNLIGKFGVGLKDALGVFARHGCEVKIYSKYHTITTCRANKATFNIETLHAQFTEPLDANMVGTEFCISGISDVDMAEAKSRFLVFNQQKCLESTRYGDVYTKSGAAANIYINGVLVATEEDFMFSYNITKINANIRKALNRERSNVGRSAYTDTVKCILKSCKSEQVSMRLCEDLSNISYGVAKVETGWTDIASRAAELLDNSAEANVVFMTAAERDSLTNQEVEILRESGKKVITIPNTVMNNINNNVTTFSNVFANYQASYTYTYVDYTDLTESEKKVFDLRNNLFKLVSPKFKTCADIRVSETIRVDLFGEHADGVREDNFIVIRRSVLQDAERFCAVLLHELGHYQHGYADNTRNFENDLTDLLGYVTYQTTQQLAVTTSIKSSTSTSVVHKTTKTETKPKPRLIDKLIGWLI